MKVFLIIIVAVIAILILTFIAYVLLKLSELYGASIELDLEDTEVEHEADRE